jgi:hypothetical protein
MQLISLNGLKLKGMCFLGAFFLEDYFAFVGIIGHQNDVILGVVERRDHIVLGGVGRGPGTYISDKK